jgi:NADH dehydrogenase (ubiquinone) 1 alpha/beta subcomplex 1, acyl-carrier protein
MAIEEEFSIEIPDKDADEIRTVQDAVKYISEQAEYYLRSFDES